MSYYFVITIFMLIFQNLIKIEHLSLAVVVVVVVIIIVVSVFFVLVSVDIVLYTWYLQA